MNKSLIEAFWQRRAQEGQCRWTDDALLSFELSRLQPYVRANSALLDLGCGEGSLSRRLVGEAGSLTLVEKQPGFLDRVADEPRLSKHCCDLSQFSYPQHYDLILLFGVVTHLTLAEERAVYRSVATHLADGGYFVVKNQVTAGPELLVDRHSEQLGCRYVGRYPNQDSQQAELAQLFRRVERIAYPPEFNKWPDTHHMLFLCSEPLPDSSQA